MSKPTGYIPQHCHHKPTGQGYVRLNGKALYTGIWGSPESQREYDRLVQEWISGGRAAPPTARANEHLNEGLLTDYWVHANPWFRPVRPERTRGAAWWEHPSSFRRHERGCGPQGRPGSCFQGPGAPSHLRTVRHLGKLRPRSYFRSELAGTDPEVARPADAVGGVIERLEGDLRGGRRWEVSRT